MSDINAIMEALDCVICFNKESIICTLSGNMIEEGKIEKVRKACEILSNEGLYEFNTSGTMKELLLQIEDFVNKGFQMS